MTSEHFCYRNKRCFGIGIYEILIIIFFGRADARGTCGGASWLVCDFRAPRFQQPAIAGNSIILIRR